MARLKYGAPIFAIPDITVWPTSKDNLSTPNGWDVFINWLEKYNRSHKDIKCPKGRNDLWFSMQKKVSHKFEFPITAGIKWGVNPDKYCFINFVNAGMPNKKYIGFIVSMLNIVPDDNESIYDID
jgi:hypothetical protein